MHVLSIKGVSEGGAETEYPPGTPRSPRFFSKLQIFQTVLDLSGSGGLTPPPLALSQPPPKFPLTHTGLVKKIHQKYIADPSLWVYHKSPTNEFKFNGIFTLNSFVLFNILS